MKPNVKKVLISLAGLVVLAGIVFAISSGSSGGVKNVFAPPQAPPPGPPPTYQPAPVNIQVPSAGEKITNKDIGVPTSVAPSTTDPNVTVRTFAIRASNNVYDPNTIIANVGEMVKINFTAVDKAYDLTIPDLNLAVSAKKKETKTLEFQAVKEGKYLFYCELCGGINSSTQGYLIIAKSE